MKKNYCSVIALSTLMFFASCSNSTKSGELQKVDSLPSNPTSGQVYKDSNGHDWIYDMAMGAWLMNTINNSGNSRHYYYYPSTGSYTDNSGRAVVPPSNISNGISNGVKARTQTVTVTKPKVDLNKSSNRNSSTFKSSNSSNTSKPTGRSVFGSTGRSSSIGS